MKVDSWGWRAYAEPGLYPADVPGQGFTEEQKCNLYETKVGGVNMSYMGLVTRERVERPYRSICVPLSSAQWSLWTAQPGYVLGAARAGVLPQRRLHRGGLRYGACRRRRMAPYHQLTPCRGPVALVGDSPGFGAGLPDVGAVALDALRRRGRGGLPAVRVPRQGHVARPLPSAGAVELAASTGRQLPAAGYQRSLLNAMAGGGRTRRRRSRGCGASARQRRARIRSCRPTRHRARRMRGRVRGTIR